MELSEDTICFSGPARQRPGRRFQEKWRRWKETFLTADGFVKDPSAHDKMVSEGLGYGLLLAVIFDDQPAFDLIVSALQKIQKTSDHLFPWLVNSQDINSASDADEDIAAALLMAGALVEKGHWPDTGLNYPVQAGQIIRAIWEFEVQKFWKLTVLVPSDSLDSFIKPEGIIINPSYFSSAWYRLFARADRSRDWKKLADDSLRIIEKMILKFREPVDWCLLKTGPRPEIAGLTGGAYGLPPFTSIFGFDAVRVPLRLAMDAILFDQPVARKLCLSILQAQKPETVKVYSAYSGEGFHNEMVVAIFAAAAAAAGVENKFLEELRSLDRDLEADGPFVPASREDEKYFYFNQTLTLLADLAIFGFLKNWEIGDSALFRG